MYRIIFFVVFIMGMLQAENMRPQLYASIGEKVYLSADGYEELLQEEYFAHNHDFLLDYVTKAKALQEKGLRLDKQSDKASRAEYVNALRHLEEQSIQIEHKVSEDLNALLVQQQFKVLKALKNSLLPYVRDSIAVRSAISGVLPDEKHLNVAQKENEILLEFKALKTQLLDARASNSERADCLNDITAVVYWMQETDAVSNEVCKAYNACHQVSSFTKAAKKSCGKEDSLYQKWFEASKKHRTTLKDSYAKECGKN